MPIRSRAILATAASTSPRPAHGPTLATALVIWGRPHARRTFVRLPPPPGWPRRGSPGHSASRAMVAAAGRSPARARLPAALQRLWFPFNRAVPLNVSMATTFARTRDPLVVAVEHIDAGTDRRVFRARARHHRHRPGDLATRWASWPGRHPRCRRPFARRSSWFSDPCLAGLRRLSAKHANRRSSRLPLVYFGFDWSLLARGAAAVLDGVRRP